MAKIKFFQFLIFLLNALILAQARGPWQQEQQQQPHHSHSRPLDHNPYRHVEILDRAGNYKLEWVVDWEKERVYFNVTVATRGWVGFGISKTAKMDGADLIMGGVDWRGRPYFTDRHAIGNQIPLVDVKQDWKLHYAWETNSHTLLSFSRAFDTCDEKDIPITDDALILLWSYGQTDDTKLYHFENKGTIPIYLRDPDLTPRVIQEARGNLIDPQRIVQGSNVNVWSLRSTFNIPTRRTAYQCNIHKITLPQKHHIIGFVFQINNDTLNNMHHLLLYRCISPNASSLLEPFVNGPGEECYSPPNPIGRIPTQSCTELKAGHAIGGRPVFFPETMGIPIGATGQSEYFLLQIHYDNEARRSGLVSVSQFDIYYTAKLRPNDGGIFSIGHHIPGSPSILLPPMEQDHRIFGHCSSTCTRKMFPPTGIRIIGGLIHAHNAGRRLAVQHFRGNRELKPVLNDDNWKFNFQPVRLLRREVNVLPGDHLAMRCYYDTTSTNRTTVGGYATDQEMCKVFAVYYNLLVNFPICRSQIVSQNYTARYLAGAANLTWDQSRLEMVARAPPNLANMTVSQISDSRFVNWTAEQIGALRRDHLIHPHLDVCPSNQDATAPSPPPPTFVNYPVQATEYKPPPPCSLL